jgi:predicted nucleic acid-binding protein
LALIDTGPLVALIDARDARHRSAARALRDEPGRVVTTWAVITEALYLLGRGHDPWYGQQPLVERIGLGGILVDDFTADLGTRTLALMQTYANVPMSLADASLVALAEQRRDLRIVTFDSDFRVYRTVEGQPLVLVDGAS